MHLERDEHYQLLKRTEHWALVYKPPLWLSVPSSKGLAETRPILGLELQRDLGQQVFPVHRLDLEVSGLMIFALTQIAQRLLNQAFEQQLVEKTYMAVTEIAPEAPNLPWDTPFTIESLLCMGKKRAFEASHGKKSLTQARCSPLNQRYLKWILNPKTGRRHQLRFHLAQQRVPILNDLLYGGLAVTQGKGIALQAVVLNFTKLLEEQNNQIKIFGEEDALLSLESWQPPQHFIDRWLG